MAAKKKASKKALKPTGGKPSKSSKSAEARGKVRGKVRPPAKLMREPAYDLVDQRVINFIPVCLQAALSDPDLARDCVGRFSKLSDDPETIGKEMARVMRERWGLDRNQTRAVAQWPGLQLLLIKQAVITSGKRLMAGHPVVARVTGRVGVPDQTTVSWSEPNYLDIQLIGLDAP